MRRIVVTDATFPGFECERAVAERHGASFHEARCSTPDDVIKAAAKADVLMVQFAKVNSAAIERLEPGSAIIRYGLGLDNIDISAAHRRGVRVAYVPDYATAEVADHSAALILAMTRKLHLLDRSVRSGQWDPVTVCASMPPLAHLRLGFVGFGRIARELHYRLSAFGFASVVFDPYVGIEKIAEGGAQAIDLESLFSTADVVTLHTPLTAGTKHIVNSERLSRMKRDAIIVNTARGDLIDSTALEAALAAGVIGGAALDVFQDEPLPMSSRLRHLPNVVLTPHAAWYSSASAQRVQSLAADELDRFLAGAPARCPAPVR